MTAEELFEHAPIAYELADDVDLDAVVREVEAVFAKHKVLGVVAVASSKRQGYGVRLPADGPMRLRGSDEVLLAPPSVILKHKAFFTALAALAEAAGAAAGSASTLFGHVVARIRGYDN